MVVDEAHRARLQLQKLRQLRRRAIQFGSGNAHVHVAGADDVKGLGQQGGEVVVLGTDNDFPARATALPEGAWATVDFAFGAETQSQVDAQAEDCALAILLLTAAFGRLGNDSRRPMFDYDGRLDFVSMLSSRPTAPRPAEIAFEKELFYRE